MILKSGQRLRESDVALWISPRCGVYENARVWLPASQCMGQARRDDPNTRLSYSPRWHPLRSLQDNAEFLRVLAGRQTPMTMVGVLDPGGSLLGEWFTSAEVVACVLRMRELADIAMTSQYS